ncbi:MAG: epimerase [Bacteroidetes bacterium]|nr:MAG: epimerase [Bacteroidota bacterium]
MKILLFGASGMVGGGVLRVCLNDPNVDSVLSVGGVTFKMKHQKLHELVVPDLFDLNHVQSEMAGFDACFYSIGVSSVGMSEETYRQLTFDLTIRIAGMVGELNPNVVFFYVSGVGSDASGKSRWMWARVRGETENRLIGMTFPAYIFRPGYIQPWKGVVSKTKSTRIMYKVLGPIFPVLKLLFPNQVTTVERIGLAMIRVVKTGHPKHLLKVREINALAGAS